MVGFIAAVRDRVARGADRYAREAAELRKQCVIEGFADDRPLVNILAVRDQMLAVAADSGAHALAVQDFMSLVDAMGAYCFFADSMVAETLPLGLESDVHGAISSLLLRRASFESQPVNPAEFAVRHPDNDNAVLLWPVSMKHPDARVRLGKHWILPSPLAGMTHFRLKDGPITTLRFDGDRGEYAIAVGQGHSVPGPETQNNYVWMEVDDWPRWERLLIKGPFIHHCAMAYGHWADAVAEACTFMSGVDCVRLDAPAM
jgi:L-fucose isomerase-like protein